MQVIVKAKFNSTKQHIESFGGGRYLVYLPFEEDKESEKLIIHILSKYMVVPPNRIAYKGKNINKDFIFEVL